MHNRESRAHFAILAPSHRYPIACTLSVHADGFIDTHATFAAWTELVPDEVRGPLDVLAQCRYETCDAMFCYTDERSAFHPAFLERVLLEIGSPDASSDSPVLELAAELAESVDRRILMYMDRRRFGAQERECEKVRPDWAWYHLLFGGVGGVEFVSIRPLIERYNLTMDAFFSSKFAPKGACEADVEAAVIKRSTARAFVEWAQNAWSRKITDKVTDLRGRFTSAEVRNGVTSETEVFDESTDRDPTIAGEHEIDSMHREKRALLGERAALDRERRARDNLADLRKRVRDALEYINLDKHAGLSAAAALARVHTTLYSSLP